NGGGAQNRPELWFENVQVIETKADRTAAEERVQFIDIFTVGVGQFVSAEVECSNDERVGGNVFRYLPICFILLLFGGQSGTVKIKKLSPIKSNTLGAAFCHCGEIAWKLDVGRKDDVPPITRSRFCLAQSG